MTLVEQITEEGILENQTQVIQMAPSQVKHSGVIYTKTDIDSSTDSGIQEIASLIRKKKKVLVGDKGVVYTV